jgi:hypothetical protein
MDLFQFQIKALSSLARLRLLNVLPVRLRRLNPRRLDFILVLKLELFVIADRFYIRGIAKHIGLLPAVTPISTFCLQGNVLLQNFIQLLFIFR